GWAIADRPDWAQPGRRQWRRRWAASQAAGPESAGGGDGGERGCAATRDARGGACPWGDAAPRRRPPVGLFVRRSSRSAPSWVRQVRWRTPVAREAEVTERWVSRPPPCDCPYPHSQ